MNIELKINWATLRFLLQQQQYMPHKQIYWETIFAVNTIGKKPKFPFKLHQYCPG